MKFGKKLQYLLEHTIPEWRPNFLAYKQLKKRLKQMGAPVAFTDLAILDVNSFSAPLLPGFLDADSNVSNGGEHESGRKRPLPEISGFDQKAKKRRHPLELDEAEGDSEETRPGAAGNASKVAQRTEEDNNFLRLVKIELHKFNAFFLEKEEEFLIRLDVLEERKQDFKELCAGSGSEIDNWTYQELIQLRKLIVTLHGEMVLLMNYSSLNYIGLVKILKKHDKQTGANLRQSALVSVLHQPFFSTTNLEQLVGRCLACEKSLHPMGPSTSENKVPVVGSFPNDAVESGPVPRQVEAALRTIQDMRRV